MRGVGGGGCIRINRSEGILVFFNLIHGGRGVPILGEIVVIFQISFESFSEYILFCD